MLDIKFIKENTDIVKDAITKKNIDLNLDDLLVLEDSRIKLIKEVDDLRARQNEAGEEITKAEGGDKVTLISAMLPLKEELKEKEEQLKKVMQDWQAMMLQVPNVPDASVPYGKSDEDNVEMKVVGEKTTFEFQPKDHIELMQDLGMVDFERGSKVHGFRGYYLKGDGVNLCFAIWQYAKDFFVEKGFNPFIAPAIARKQNFYGTGHLPNEAEDLYVTQDEDFLSGTAEVPMMGYYSGEVLSADELPVKQLAFSPCYRREAGSYGKDTKGLIRVHEFFKWEQIVLCEASHEESVKYHEWINANTEEFIQSLNIPYHAVINCSGDLGLGQVKKYDVELWVPQEGKYREISSASYFHDFQARRFNIKYKNSEGKINYVHSLNCTAIPTPRILVSLVENFQQADGTIKIPGVLRKYMGNREYIGK